jgi:hypothetical protein
MNALESALKEHGSWIDSPSAVQVNEIYLRGISLLDLPKKLPKNEQEEKPSISEYSCESFATKKESISSTHLESI